MLNKIKSRPGPHRLPSTENENPFSLERFIGDQVNITDDQFQNNTPAKRSSKVTLPSMIPSATLLNIPPRFIQGRR